MELNYLKSLPLGGFNYDNCLRNKAMEANLGAAYKKNITKTGTTICGARFTVSNRNQPDLSAQMEINHTFIGWCCRCC